MAWLPAMAESRTTSASASIARLDPLRRAAIAISAAAPATTPSEESTKPAPSASRGVTSSVPTSAATPSAAERAVKSTVAAPPTRIQHRAMSSSAAPRCSGMRAASGRARAARNSTEPISTERPISVPAFSTTERKP